MTPATALKLGPIGQVSIVVKDVARATAFYRDVLGLKFLFEAPGMAFFDAGGVRLYLGLPEKPEFDRTSVLYFRVEDIQGAQRAMESGGVTFKVGAHKVHEDASRALWLAFFPDSEGNVMALMSEVAKQGP